MTTKKVEKKSEIRAAQKTAPDGGGLRFDEGKVRLELVPPEWFWALADVTTKGSMKYPERNWERGMSWAKMIGCALRHVFKFCMGERYDGTELNIELGTTGCHHLAMAAWNLLALMSYDLRGIGDNDIPQSNMGILARVNVEGTANVKKPTAASRKRRRS